MALQHLLDAEVTAVGSAAAAFQHLDAHPAPDLIILDVMMPQVDGYTACRQLRARDGLAAVPVIFLTARLGTAEEEKGAAAGGTGFLAKPFDPMTLGTQLTELLASAGHIL